MAGTIRTTEPCTARLLDSLEDVSVRARRAGRRPPTSAVLAAAAKAGMSREKMMKMVESLLDADVIRARKDEHGRRHPACFSGAAAVSVWMKRRLVVDLIDAIDSGRALLVLGCLAPVQHAFDDEGDDDAAIGALPEMFTGRSERLFYIVRRRVERLIFKASDEEPTAKEMEPFRVLVENGVVRDRRLRRHAQCFSGKDAVSVWIQDGIVNSKSEAIALGRRMLRRCIIRHVDDHHHFCGQAAMLYCVVERRGAAAAAAAAVDAAVVHDESGALSSMRRNLRLARGAPGSPGVGVAGCGGGARITSTSTVTTDISQCDSSVMSAPKANAERAPPSAVSPPAGAAVRKHTGGPLGGGDGGNAADKAPASLLGAFAASEQVPWFTGCSLSSNAAPTRNVDAGALKDLSSRLESALSSSHGSTVSVDTDDESFVTAML